MKHKKFNFIISTCIVAVIFGILAHLQNPPSPVWALSPVDQGLKRAADFYFDVAVGDVRGHSSVNKFGRNEEIDTADGIEDIWDGGGTWPEPSASQIYTFTSTSTADAAAGTGARTIEIFGLGPTSEEQNEALTMNGTTPVTAASSYSMIHRMVVLSAGSGGENAGVITANANTDANITAQIAISNNQTLMAIYKIPAGNDGCLVNFFVDVNKSGGATTSVDAILYVKPDGQVWQIKQLNGAISGGTSRFNHFFGTPNCFEPLTLIKLAANVSANDTGVSGGYDLVLHPN